MNNFVILTDSRQQKEKHILKEFDKQGILHIRTGLPSADYMALRYDDKQGFYLDYSVLVDSKKDLLEMSGNLCNSSQHDRLKREIKKGFELGAKEFIFLIGSKDITNVEDIKNWSSPHTKVRGSTLLKVMVTMSKKYGVKFIICPRKKMGEKILEILNKKY
jgi:hypothetical protein